jgi:hypothetical protein
MPTQKSRNLPWMDPELNDVDEAFIKSIEESGFFNRDEPTAPHSNISDAPGQAQTSEPSTQAPVDTTADATSDNAPSTDDQGQSQGGASTPSASTPEPSVESQTPEGEGVSSFKFQVDGQDVELNADQAAYLVQLHSWLNNKPQEVLNAWNDIEQGTSKAVSADEYAQFQAWKAGGSPATRDQTPTKPDLSYLDDETRAYVESLEKRVPTSTVAPTPTINPAQVQQQADYAAQQRVQWQQEVDSKLEAFATKYELTPEQVKHLHDATSESQIVANITLRRTRTSPTGQVIARPSIGDVLDEAFEITMSSDPQLSRVRDDYTYNQRLAAERDRNQTVNGKKAAAGSLASAPTAAVSSGQTDMSKLTAPQREAAMAAEFADAMKNGTWDQ